MTKPKQWKEMTEEEKHKNALRTLRKLDSLPAGTIVRAGLKLYRISKKPK